MNLKIIHINGCESYWLCNKKHKNNRYGKVKALKGLLIIYCSPNILKRPSIRNSNNHAAFRNVTYQVPLQLIYTFPGQIFARTRVDFTHSSYIYVHSTQFSLCSNKFPMLFNITRFNILIVLIFLSELLTDKEYSGSVYLKYSNFWKY